MLPLLYWFLVYLLCTSSSYFCKAETFFAHHSEAGVTGVIGVFDGSVVRLTPLRVSRYLRI
jgi:hypothetical protein